MSGTNGPSARQLEILRSLAAREAARRQAESQQQQERATSLETSAQRDGEELTSQRSGEGSLQLDAVDLERLWKEEKARNDFAWAKVREETDLLSQKAHDGGHPSTADAPADRRRRKKTELAMLEFEFERITKDLGTLEEPKSDAILMLLARSAIASSIIQYEEALKFLQAEREAVENRTKDDEQLLQDLAEVRKGLSKRKSVLASRRATSDLGSVEKKLSDRVAKMEDNLSQLLRSLIDLTRQVFVDDDGVQQAQLRHLIDQLINKAWDTPADPYVNVAEDYLPAIPTFLLRANVAVEHPRDANRIRLVEFHRSTVG